MCCATSHVIVVVSWSIVMSTVRAVLISGSWLGGNSTSTTGPITRTTRPCACSSSFWFASGIGHPSLAEDSASAPPTISRISVVISS